MEPLTKRGRLGEPVLYCLWPREVEHLPGAGLRIAAVGEAREHAGRFIDEWQGLAIVYPLEVGSGISGGLLLDHSDLMAPILTLGLDNAGRFLVDKENVVGGANIRPILTSGDPETSAEVDFIVVLNYPTRIG